MTDDAKTVELDRMRYTKDKLSANMALGAIAVNAVGFISVYRSDVGSFYYDWVIGASVILNLLFMMSAFLASEGVKSRKQGYPFLLMLLGALQVGRVFFLPMRAHNAVVKIKGESVAAMQDAQFVFIICCLLISALLCIASGIISYLRSRRLSRYMNSLEGLEVDSAWQS